MNGWVEETGLPYRHLSRILSMSIGENNPPEVLREYMGDIVSRFLKRVAQANGIAARKPPR